METEQSLSGSVYPISVLKLIDSLRKEHYQSADRLSSFLQFQTFDWELYKKHAQGKFLIIFTLENKDFTMTPSTTTQLKMTQKGTQKDKGPPKHLFVTMTLCHSKTTHRFLIKRCSKYLYKMFNEERNDIYVATEVSMKLLHKGNDFEIIFASTLKTAYRKITEDIYSKFFTAECRNVDIFSMNNDEKAKVVAYNNAKKSKMHPSDFEWDISEFCNFDGSVLVESLFRLKDYSTTIIGYVSKVKKTLMVIIKVILLTNVVTIASR